MNKPQYTILLADDDKGGCVFFKNALDELPFAAVLIVDNILKIISFFNPKQLL